MWSLCLLCVLLSLVPGQNIKGSNHTELYARSGSNVSLPLGYNLTVDNNNKIQQCSNFDWTFQSEVKTKLSKSRTCDVRDYANKMHFPNHSKLPFSNYKSSVDGTLSLINVTWKNTGNYNVVVSNTTGWSQFHHNYTLYVQGPVSEPLLNVSCRPDGGADIICGNDFGQELFFSIMVNKGLLLENANASKIVGNFTGVNTTVASPGPWNITCSIRNRVSDNETRRMNVICPVPLSDPILEASCLQNGSLKISCSVANGTDPIYFLYVNETLFSTNVRNAKKTVNHVTLSSPEPWDVTCYVNNSLGEKNAKTNKTCEVPLSDPILHVSCHDDTSLEISCSVEKGTDPIFSLSVNNLILKNVTMESKRVNATVSIAAPWDVHCSVRNNLGDDNTRKSYKTCPVPLSLPFINASCQNDGAAKVVCEVAEGRNATYNWTINKELILWNTVPILTINASEFVSGAINISCSAENSISKTHSNDTTVFCDAPVSQPLLNITCLSNGSVMITCSVLSGTNPKFRLTANGNVLMPLNTSSPCCGFNYVMSQGSTWNISCSVSNLLGEPRTSISSCSCGALNSTCLSCLEKSIIGGFVALIVTTSPIFIVTYYIERNMRQKQL